MIYPADDVDPLGQLCEVECKGRVHFGSLAVEIDVQSASAEADSLGKDIYELSVSDNAGNSYVLYDFVKLRNGTTGEDIELEGTGYGRAECVTELIKAIRGPSDDSASGSNLVTPRQAQEVQRIISDMKGIA